VRAHRFPSALVAALGAHAAVVLAIASARSSAPRESIAPAPLDALVFVTEEPSDAPPPPSIEPGSARAPRAPVVPPRTPVATPREPGPSSLEEPPAPDVESPPTAAALPAPSSSARVIDLGIGTYWENVALGALPASTADEAREPSPPLPSPARILRDALDAHDRAIGLGSEGPLVSAAHEAASPEIAPDVGSATLEIECDANGGAVTARVVYTASDAAAWSDVARELAKLVSSKRLHVPPGARGVRTRLEIVAERALPSGEKLETKAGAVPDDVPGGDRVCEGTGSTRRCTGGSPVGTTQTLGDLSNIGARRSRIVHVQVLSEQTL
jgi:hypothetical protein